MKPKYVVLGAAICVMVAGGAVWWATRPGPGQPPEPVPDAGGHVAAASEPTPALELVGRVEGLRPGLDGERSFNLRLARPDPPATESADAAHLRESIGVVHVRLRPAAAVTGDGPLREGLVVRVRSVRSQPKPTYPPTWFPDSVRIVSVNGVG